MRAIVNFARGAAQDTLKLIERPLPLLGEGEVLVRLYVSGVNPSDSKVRSGAQGPLPALEVIPHNDGAGVIEAVGPGVSQARIDERVWLYNVNRSDDGLTQGVIGTAAEYVVVPEALAAPLFEGASFELGATLGVPAMTAFRAVFGGGPVAGKRLLITGGAGAVGLYAVQMAAASGATVIATVSSAEKAAIAKAGGATHVVNYREGDLKANLLALLGGQKIDRIVDVDFAAHIELVPALLAASGSIGAYASGRNLTPVVPFYPFAMCNAAVDFIFIYALPPSLRQEIVEGVSYFVRQGVLKPVIAAHFALEACADAHETLEGGVTGNVVLTLREEA